MGEPCRARVPHCSGQHRQHRCRLLHAAKIQLPWDRCSRSNSNSSNPHSRTLRSALSVAMPVAQEYQEQHTHNRPALQHRSNKSMVLRVEVPPLVSFMVAWTCPSISTGAFQHSTDGGRERDATGACKKSKKRCVSTACE